MGFGGDSPAELPHNLEGMDFPADRMKLIRHARQHHADPKMVEKLERMPDEQYGSVDEVVEEYKRH
jgi:hypothetical protein